jgi:hypothetical protein
MTFFNDFLSYDKGLSIGMATLVVLLFGLGGAIGARRRAPAGCPCAAAARLGRRGGRPRARRARAPAQLPPRSQPALEPG